MSELEDATPAAALPEEKAAQPQTGHEFRGYTPRHAYPFHTDPRRGGPLVVDPGEVVDFGDDSPPADGLWYDVRSGEQFVPEQVSTGPAEIKE